MGPCCWTMAGPLDSSTDTHINPAKEGCWFTLHREHSSPALPVKVRSSEILNANRPLLDFVERDQCLQKVILAVNQHAICGPGTAAVTQDSWRRIVALKCRGQIAINE